MNRRLTTLDGFGMFTAWILILGTLISYTPQYYKIYKNKNTHGISESMLIFGIYSSYLNVLGTIQENLFELNNCGILTLGIHYLTETTSFLRISNQSNRLKPYPLGLL